MIVPEQRNLLLEVQSREQLELGLELEPDTEIDTEPIGSSMQDYSMDSKRCYSSHCCYQLDSKDLGERGQRIERYSMYSKEWELQLEEPIHYLAAVDSMEWFEPIVGRVGPQESLDLEGVLLKVSLLELQLRNLDDIEHENYNHPLSMDPVVH